MKIKGRITKIETIEMDLTPEDVARQLQEAHDAYWRKTLEPYFPEKLHKVIAEGLDHFNLSVQKTGIWCVAISGRHPRDYEFRGFLPITHKGVKEQCKVALKAMSQVLEVSKHITISQKKA